MTHYWDCCTPSCAQPGKPGERCTSCVSGYKPEIYDLPTDINICGKQGGNKSMCFNQIPWMEGKILYGYGAVSTGSSAIYGEVYEVEFNPNNIVKTGYIMITNDGDSGDNNIDLALPGGGFGEFNGCLQGGTNAGKDLNSNWNIHDACNKGGKCTQYGGFSNISQCDIAFRDDAAALTACKDILFGIFGQMGCNYDAGYQPNLGIKSKKKIN